jgi:hypothetical protein
MAVYQISKIQIRRGKARTGPGFPQLASGELGWAVDSQELYIGNGSVSEGAPTVGNTKILTSKDIISGSGGTGLISLLEHTYKLSDTLITTGPSISFPVVRSLQNILDDTVNVYDFGAKGDGITDDSSAIQRAITQLFANSGIKSFSNTSEGVKRRVILKMPAGIFKTINAITIPSYTTIIGAGIDKTIIQYTGLETAFRCISDVGSSYPLTNPRYINIQDITIQSTETTATIGLDLANTSNSKFQNIKIIGTWDSGSRPDNKGISISSLLATTSSDIIFDNVVINNYFCGVFIGNASTDINFINGVISTAHTGFSLGVDLVSDGPSNINISNYKFDNIIAHAINSDNSIKNTVINCNLTNVGEGGDTESTVPQIYFSQLGNYNSSITSDRSIALSDPLSALQYVPEVSGSAVYTSTPLTVDIAQSVESVDLFRLPLKTDSTGTVAGFMSYTINYIFNGNYIRQGQISLIASPPSINSSDDYTCTGISGTAMLLKFTAAIVNNSIVVSYTNTISGNDGTLTYSYIATS